MMTHRLLITSFVLLLVACTNANPVISTNNSSLSSFSSSFSSISSLSSTSSPQAFPYPLPDGKSRITKKMFGTYVTPQNSPVQPERFRGYHTGTDFETFPDEAKTDVAVKAICDGTALYHDWVSGYGGVFIQSCTYDNQPVTVLYGHLDADAIVPNKGVSVHTGDFIGTLGEGYTRQTDGERKHLHLSIHKGTTIELKGYVQTAQELDQWINAYP